MPKNDHYAILVTITKYPGLSDLEGPEADGDAFVKWLTSPDGGDLPLDNVTHIRTADFIPFDGDDAYDAKPTETQFKRALNNLLREGEEHSWKDKAGERLYLYFGGHGHTAGTSLNDPALFSAVAQNGDTAHIAGYRYAAKIASAGFFDEILLFMDCCQDVLKASQVIEPTWSPPDRERSHRVKLLQAIGAPRGKKAFERDLDGNGIVRGLFTVVVLEALHTAIPDDEGWVNGYDFKKRFDQIWGERFRDDTFYTPPVLLPGGPDIQILHRSSADTPDNATIRVNLSNVDVISLHSRRVHNINFTSLRNRRVHRLGNASRPFRTFNINNELLNLPAGMFTIETEDGRNDLAFEVLSSGNTTKHIRFHEVPALSATVSEAQRFEVTVDGTDSAIQLKILDSDYNTVVTGNGSLVAELTPGVYKAELTAGGARSQQIFRVVDGPLTVTPPVPRFPAAAPVDGTSTSHEYHSGPAKSLAEGEPLHSFPEADSELVVFVRASELEYGSTIARPYPWEGLLLRNFTHDQQTWRIPLEVVNKEYFFGAMKLAVPSGSYSLYSTISDELDSDEFGFVLRTVSGWRTEVYIDSTLEPLGEAGETGPLARADFSRAAVHLIRIGEPSLIHNKLGTRTELERIRLFTGDQAIPPSDEDVKRSPMLGIYAAYSAFQQDPEDKSTIRRCLRAIPDEVRALTDVQLLEAWLNPDATFSLLQPLDIPLLSLSWGVSRRLPPEHQLAPDLCGILGQWRIGSSLWTSWRRSTQINTSDIDGSSGTLSGDKNYDTVLATIHRLPTDGSQPMSLDPPWNMDYWRGHQDDLRPLVPGISPFQQALRRLLLDAIDIQEDIVEEQIFQLGDQYDLDRKWTVSEYRSFSKRIAPIG
ncbi:Peptidase C14 caspase domain-containing protein [Candidatus Electrothrix aarhusensis]